MYTIVDIDYGHRMQSDDDEYAKLIEEGAGGIEAATTGVSPLDFFPFLQYIPPWVPGCSGLTAIVREWRGATRRMIETPFLGARKQLAAGTVQPSFCAHHLERLAELGKENDREELKHIEGAAGVILTGGLETTFSTLQVFVLAMVLFPEAQRKAQEEIDSVIGQDRLPGFDDRPRLPYVNCLLQEVLRWHPVVPLGLPHRTVEDDIYKGMCIPARSIIIPNIRAMCRDANVYKNPEQFSPERFLPAPAGQGEPYFEPIWGFGRRICPGRHVGSNSLWIVIATVLATFHISKMLGPDGKPVGPEIAFITTAQTSPPKPFKYSIRPRSKTAEKLIAQLGD